MITLSEKFQHFEFVDLINKKTLIKCPFCLQFSLAKTWIPVEKYICDCCGPLIGYIILCPNCEKEIDSDNPEQNLLIIKNE